MASRVRPRLAWLLLAVVCGLATLGVWGFSFLRTAFACSWDTSYCATGETREYRGRLFDYEGRPAQSAALSFSGDAYERQRLQFLTDDQGRFCVVAAEGVTTSYVTVEGQVQTNDLVVRSTAPVDPRLATPAARDAFKDDLEVEVDYLPFMASEPLVTQLQEPRGTFDSIGAHDAPELWNLALDAAPTCQTLASPRWYRVDGLTSTWQFAVLMAAPALTILLVLAGVVSYPAARHAGSASAARRAERTLQLACAAAVATALLTYAIWTYL